MIPLRYRNQFGYCAWLLLGLWMTAGATCHQKRALTEFQPPEVFRAPPDIQQLAEVINRNRSIQQLESNAVTVRTPGIPTLSARILWERPRRFRMTGGLSRLTGTDFDLGSNDDLFWMATRHGPSPTLYFARHDQFDSQMNRQVLPVSPDWLVEAMGIVELDPATVTETPNMRADGMLEVQSLINSQIGSYRRTLVIDPKYATVRQVILRDPSGRMLATSTLSNHQHYPALQVSLPHRVQVQLMPVGAEPLDLDVVVSFYSLNDNQGTDPQRWTIPDTAGYTVVDLVQINASHSNQLPPSAIQFPQYQQAQPPVPKTSYRGVGDIR